LNEGGALEQHRAEFQLIADALQAYEAKRWPEGAVPGGKME